MNISAAEGINNTIKVFKRRAYGCRDENRLALDPRRMPGISRCALESSQVPGFVPVIPIVSPANTPFQSLTISSGYLSSMFHMVRR
ncbi:hypothetical protein C5O80_34430 [Burkholderia sp. SRS-46]|nr:hypothetical protein C5O80_34430 [Burkholderia sp. SRS-46]